MSTNMKRLWYLFLSLFLLGIGVFLLGNKKSPTVLIDHSSGTKVATSFYPIYYFATRVAGDHGAVINITPAGAEPHDYEPTTQDIVAINHSQLLLLNGGGLEIWADRIRGQLPHTVIVVTGEGLAREELEEAGKKIIDPHVWLSPPLAKKQVEKIRDGLISVDAVNKDFYQKNGVALEGELEKLNQQYKMGLQTCKQKDIVTSHTAFGYLAKAYGLNQVAISGLSPDQEPSPKQLVEVTAFVRKHNIKYIFFETLVSPKLAQIIANETGAKTLVLNPLEGLATEEINQGKNYFTVMEENLKNLRLALECQ